MITLRRSNERGRSRHDWLESYHSFSFADYYDPEHMGVSALRVLNDDRVVPGGGFAKHGHRDMEIISYVVEGALEHRDSMDNVRVVRAGDFQRMSAGAGVQHSEYNASTTEPVHFLQIWIVPNEFGIAPEYEERNFADARGLHLVASGDGREQSLRLHQDASLYLWRVAAGEAVNIGLDGRTGYVHCVSGQADLDGHELATGDGAAVTSLPRVELTATEACELLIFDLP